MNVLKMLNKKVRRGKRGVLVAVPSYNNLIQAEGWSKAWTGGALSLTGGFPWVIEPYVVVKRYPVSDARNAITEYFYKRTTHDYLVMIDNDMGWPENWPDIIGHGDIVSGLTWMWASNRDPEKRLQFNQFKIDPETNVSSTIIPPPGYLEEGKPYEVDLVGTACVCIHRRVFDRLGPRPFEEPASPDGIRWMGEDIAFFRKARREGFKVIVRPNVAFNHYQTLGLQEVYETQVVMTKIAYREGLKRGFEQGVKEALKAMRETGGGANVQVPTLDQAIAAAGGAA